MSQHIASADLAQLAAVSEQPPLTRIERNFGLPSGLYIATVGLYLAFIGLMAVLFSNPELALPLAIIVGTIVFGFGLAGRWAAMKPDHSDGPMSWGQFANRGISTLSGPLTAFEASAQVLVLPILILLWGACIAAIVAFT